MIKIRFPNPKIEIFEKIYSGIKRIVAGINQFRNRSDTSLLKSSLPVYREILLRNSKEAVSSFSRSGNLRNSLSVVENSTGTRFDRILLRSTLPYARAVSSGFGYDGYPPLKPKKSKYLTIPLGRNKGTDGQKIKSLRDFSSKETFLLKKTRAGVLQHPLVMLKLGYDKGSKSQRIEPIFQLRKSLTMRGNYWIPKAREKTLADLKEHFKYDKKMVDFIRTSINVNA